MREVGSQLLFRIFSGKNLLRQSVSQRFAKQKSASITLLPLSDKSAQQALSRDSQRCISLNVYERERERGLTTIFLEDGEMNVCQLNWLDCGRGCCFQQNIGDIDL